MEVRSCTSSPRLCARRETLRHGSSTKQVGVDGYEVLLLLGNVLGTVLFPLGQARVNQIQWRSEQTVDRGVALLLEGHGVEGARSTGMGIFPVATATRVSAAP